MSQMIFCKGRAAQATLSTGVAAGGQSLTLAQAGSLFAAGDQLFAAAAGGTGAQWLGTAVQAGAAGLSFSRPLDKDLTAGSSLWSAQWSLRLAFKTELGAQSKHGLGVSVQRSLEGNYTTTQISAPLREDTLTLYPPGVQVQQAVLDWLEQATQWGLCAFTLVETATGAMRAARLSGAALESTILDGQRHRLRLPVHLLEEGTYQ